MEVVEYGYHIQYSQKDNRDTTKSIFGLKIFEYNNEHSFFDVFLNYLFNLLDEGDILLDLGNYRARSELKRYKIDPDFTESDNYYEVLNSTLHKFKISETKTGFNLKLPIKIETNKLIDIVYRGYLKATLTLLPSEIVDQDHIFRYKNKEITIEPNNNGNWKNPYKILIQMHFLKLSKRLLNICKIKNPINFYTSK